MKPLAPTNTIRDHLRSDHGELEELFTRLLAALEAHDREESARGWSEFDDRLSRHLEAEEYVLIPPLSSARPREARALLEEHRHIRSRLVELGLGTDLHGVRLGSARAFLEELRAHARHEEGVLYEWADDHLTEQEQGALFSALTEPRRARDRIV